MTTFEWLLLAGLAVMLWLLSLIVSRLNQVVSWMVDAAQTASRLEHDISTVAKSARDLDECLDQLSNIEAQVASIASDLQDAVGQVRTADSNDVLPGLRAQIRTLREAVESVAVEIRTSVSDKLQAIEVNTRR